MVLVKIVLSAAAISFAAITATPAQTYPDRPVRLINPYAPGGSTSVVSQALAAKFQDISGQPMVVELMPGAASNIGSAAVAKAKPDGYTVLLGTSSLAINPHLYPNMPFDPLKDLAPVVKLISTPNVLAVHPSLPVRTVTELIEYARRNPGKLNYGSSGNGATNHMGMEAFKTVAKLNIVHVPFKGGGPAMLALVGGQVQVMFNPASTLVPQHTAGRLRMLAVASERRVEGLNLPTVSESGLPGFVSGVWFGMFAPVGTPVAVINKLNADVNRILKDPQVLAILDKAGQIPEGGTPDRLGKLLATDHAMWENVVKVSGVKID